MIRRQRFPKLPTQGNYYPMASSAYIEDKRVRLTIATAQPLGVASMASGQLEVNHMNLILSKICIYLQNYINLKNKGII